MIISHFKNKDHFLWLFFLKQCAYLSQRVCKPDEGHLNPVHLAWSHWDTGLSITINTFFARSKQYSVKLSFEVIFLSRKISISVLMPAVPLKPRGPDLNWFMGTCVPVSVTHDVSPHTYIQNFLRRRFSEVDSKLEMTEQVKNLCHSYHSHNNWHKAKLFKGSRGQQNWLMGRQVWRRVCWP